MKRQPSEWEKVIANETTDKGLISKIYKQFIQLNTRKTNNPIKKWEKDLNRHFSKKTYRWLTNTWKDAQHCSLLEKFKTKLQWGVISHWSEWSISKCLQTKCWRHCEEKGTISHCWRKCKLIQPLWKTVWIFLQKKTRIKTIICCCSSVSVMSDSLWPHELQHARLPCYSLSPRYAQTHVHWLSDAIQPAHCLSLPSPPPAFNLSQHRGLFQWVGSSHQVAKVLEFQHRSFQWIFRTDFL